MTGFGSEGLGVLAGVNGGADAFRILRSMVRDQIQLTPPTRTQGTDDETDSVAYRLGSLFGYLLILAVPVAAIVIVRSRHRGPTPPAPTAPADAWEDPFLRPIVHSSTPATYPSHPPTAPSPSPPTDWPEIR